MDEHDFDQILQTDFHPNTAPAPEHHVHVQPMQDVQVHEHEGIHEHDVNQYINPNEEDEHGDIIIESAFHDSSALDRPEPELPSPLRKGRDRSDSDPSLTAGEKKRKQRELNRLAASRSRKKKHGEL